MKSCDVVFINVFLHKQSANFTKLDGRGWLDVDRTESLKLLGSHFGCHVVDWA
jgi:hypothetical protein